LELFSLEEEATQLPGGLFVFGLDKYGVDSLAIGTTGRWALPLSQKTELRRLFNVSSVEHPGGAKRMQTEIPIRGREVMFCDGCGAAVQAGQSYCSKCGKQILGSISLARPIRGRVQQHSYLLGILWLALSAFNAVGGLVLLLLGTTFFPHLREMNRVPPDVPIGFLTSLFAILGIVVLAKAALGFLAGWGLLHPEPWARVVALVLGFISLFNIPFGTALGIYTLWVLLPSGSQDEYDALVAARAA
jgi:hypothetical protein